MSSPYLIPGNAPGPSPFRQLPVRSRTSPVLKIVVIVWLVGGLGFAAWKMVSPKTTPPNPIRATARASSMAISAEDLLHHVVDVNSKLDATTARLRRAEGQISRTLPSLDRNYLPLERQYLENALSITESSRRDLERTRQEVDLILNSLKENEIQ